ASDVLEPILAAVNREFHSRADFVRRDINEGRFRSARNGIEDLAAQRYHEVMTGLSEELDALRDRVSSREEEVCLAFRSEEKDLFAERDARYAARDFLAVRDEASHLTKRLEAVAAETPSLEKDRDDVKASWREAEAIVRLYQRAASRIAGKPSFRLRRKGG